MNTNKDFFKVAIISGLIMTGVLILLDMLMYSLDLLGHSVIIGLLSLTVSVSSYIYFGRNYRNKYFDGIMSYSRSFSFILIMSGVFALVFAFYNYMFYAFFDPERLQKMIELQLQGMRDWGMSEDILAEQEARIRSSMTALSVSLWSILGGVMNGLIFGSLSALFVRKKETINDVF